MRAEILETVCQWATECRTHRFNISCAEYARDRAIRTAALEHGHKLETIARASGLSKQRISQIVKDGGE